MCLTKSLRYVSHIYANQGKIAVVFIAFFYCQFKYNVWLKRNEIEYNSFDSAFFFIRLACSLLVCACHAFFMQLSYRIMTIWLDPMYVCMLLPPSLSCLSCNIPGDPTLIQVIFFFLALCMFHSKKMALNREFMMA